MFEGGSISPIIYCVQVTGWLLPGPGQVMRFWQCAWHVACTRLTGCARRSWREESWDHAKPEMALSA